MVLGQVSAQLAWTIWYLADPKRRDYWPRWSAFRKEAALELFRRSGFFCLVQITSLAVAQTDALLILHFLRAEDVTPYNVAQKALGLVASLFGLLVQPLWAAYGNARAHQDADWIEAAHGRVRGLFLGGFALALLGLGWFGPWLLTRWVGAAATPAVWLLLGVGVVTGLRIWTDLHGTLLNSFEVFRPLLINLVVHPVLTLGIAFATIGSLGVYGLVLGGVLGYALFIAWYAPLQTRRLIRRVRAGSAVPT